jgi:hypothetical protein
MRRIVLLAAAVISAAFIIPSCSGDRNGGGSSDLYLLEELEAARSVEDVETRIERLEIYAANNSDHPYRSLAYEDILEAMAVEMGDVEGALAYFESLMEKEKDGAIRGRLIFAKFGFFWETDSLRSVSLAREVIESDEKDFRLLLYMAYYLMGAEGQEETAEALLKRLIEVAGDDLKKNHARTVYAEFLDKKGRADEAADLLELASAYTFANEPAGRMLWNEGKREEALEKYIRLAAGAPGYRGYIALDSLYSLVYPSAGDLDSRIDAVRVFEGEKVPDREFVDIRGKRHSIAGYSGAKIVITAFSPT